MLAVASCKNITGPRGLRQSEWVFYCLDNPELDLCENIDPSWPVDSVYFGGMIFSPENIREYRCDTLSGVVRCSWVSIVDPDSKPDIRKDTIKLITPSGVVGLFGYSLEGGQLIIRSTNPALSAIKPGSVFTNVEPIPDNFSGIVEVP